MVPEVTFETARRYAELRLALKRAGRPIPSNDLWIAATCLRHGLVLVTADAHFTHCPGLVVENWLESPEP
jgi:tRNA(fMet)-specific endonuclease VapC